MAFLLRACTPELAVSCRTRRLNPPPHPPPPPPPPPDSAIPLPRLHPPAVHSPNPHALVYTQPQPLLDMPAPTTTSSYGSALKSANGSGLSDTMSLFSVEGLVAVVTGGGTGGDLRHPASLVFGIADPSLLPRLQGSGSCSQRRSSTTARPYTSSVAASMSSRPQRTRKV